MHSTATFKDTTFDQLHTIFEKMSPPGARLLKIVFIRSSGSVVADVVADDELAAGALSRVPERDQIGPRNLRASSFFGIGQKFGTPVGFRVVA